MENFEKRYQVFVSSTYTDLIEERKEATQAILKCNCFPSGMELFPASNQKQWNVIKKVIDDSDFYLLILAGRYGSLGIDDFGNKIGYTEMEFDYAMSKGKPIIAMIHRSPDNLLSKFTEKTEHNIKRLNKFREKAMNGRMVAFWDNKDQLSGEIFRSLNEMKLTTPEAVGWVRADNFLQISSDLPNSIPLEDKIKELVVSKDIINLLEDADWSERVKFFENVEFVDKFIKLFNSDEPIDLIRKAIDLIPKLSYKVKAYLKEKIDVKSLFLAQCKDGIFLDTELSDSIFWLLSKLDINSLVYAEPMLNYIKTCNSVSKHTSKCVRYLEDCSFYHASLEFRDNLLEYILNELKNEKRLLSIYDLTNLLVSMFKDEDGYVQIYDIFTKSNQTIQKSILNSIFIFCGEDVYINTPKIQRMFFDMCEIVFSWNDEEIIAELLLYCLFVRTSDIFAINEVYDKLDEFNDDVFFIFFWHLGYGEFGMGAEEYYTIDSKEAHRIEKIIKKRKHPREKKLLENLSRLYR